MLLLSSPLCSDPQFSSTSNWLCRLISPSLRLRLCLNAHRSFFAVSSFFYCSHYTSKVIIPPLLCLIESSRFSTGRPWHRLAGTQFVTSTTARFRTRPLLRKRPTLLMALLGTLLVVLVEVTMLVPISGLVPRLRCRPCGSSLTNSTRRGRGGCVLSLIKPRRLTLEIIRRRSAFAWPLMLWQDRAPLMSWPSLVLLAASAARALSRGLTRNDDLNRSSSFLYFFSKGFV